MSPLEQQLEQFENQWQPDLDQDHLIAFCKHGPDGGERSDLAWEVAMIDMERHWKHWHESLAQTSSAVGTTGILETLAALPRAHHYRDFGATFGLADDFMHQLSAEEQRVRWLWGDCPATSQLPATAKPVAWAGPVVRVTMDSKSAVTLQTSGLFQIGRQAQSEPPPVAIFSNEVPRIITHDMGNRRVSRSQATVQTLCRSHGIITNSSTNRCFCTSPVNVLEPGKSCLFRFPLLFRLDGVSIELRR